MKAIEWNVSLQQGGPVVTLGNEQYILNGRRLVNAPCCCWGEDHQGHPYCSEPSEALLQAERDGLIARRLDTGWVWEVI